MKALELTGLSVRVGAKTILHDVTLAIEAGTWTSVVGPNGAGKTTLIETMAGLRRPTTGSVRVREWDIAELDERTRARHVAFVPQHPVVPTGMRVDEYVMLGRVRHHGLLRAPSEQDRSVTAGVIERTGLADLATRDFATLSGGERQRAVLARALAQSTEILLLDEPITGLDVRHQIEFLELLAREVRDCGLTVVSTMHDLTLAGQFASRLLVVHQASVVLDGPAHEIIRSPRLSELYGWPLRVISVEGSDLVVPWRDDSASP